MNFHYTKFEEICLNTTGYHFRFIIADLILKVENLEILNNSKKNFIGAVSETDFWIQKNTNLKQNYFNPFQFTCCEIIGEYNYENNQTKVKIWTRMKAFITWMFVCGFVSQCLFIASLLRKLENYLYLCIPMVTIIIYGLIILMIRTDAAKIKQILTDHISNTADNIV